MNDTVTVSVILPTYNCARYLPAAISSVLAQTYRDFELIVVNDGSTDETDDVLRPYRDRIRYVDGPHRGVGAARNIGIKLAKGRLIAFLDADDTWHADKLAAQVAFFDAHPTLGVCFTNFTVTGAPVTYRTGFDQRDGALFRYPRKPVAPHAYAITSKRLVEDFLRVQAFPQLSTVVIRRDCFDKVGLFDESLSRHHDTQMYLRLAKYFEFAYLERCLVNRLLRADSLSSSQPDRYVADHIKMFETVANWISLSKREARALRGVLAHYRFAAGYAAFSAYRLREARSQFWRSIWTHRTFAAWVYCAASCLPVRILRVIRQVKQSF